MSLVKVGTKNMTVPQKIQFARQVVIDMTGNANFTTPAPTLASITTAATALETAYNSAQTARQVAKSQTANQDAKSLALDLLLAQEANYVENTSGGDRTKITSSGFGVRNPATPIGILDMVTNLAVAPSQSEGSADLKWKKVRGAKSYVIERAPDGGSLVWDSIATPTKAKASVNTMTPGVKYWFRVSGVGAAGQGPWSEPVFLYAP
jgi:hypothetical protein